MELTLTGAKLDDPLAVWASVPGTIEVLPGEAGKTDQTVRRCKVTLDASTAVGLASLLVGTSAGASDFAWLLVDDLDSQADNAKNHSLAEAQAIPVPSAVDGVADGTQFDYFKFTAAAGQRIAVEVVAARMGSTMDPVVRLLDGQGKEMLIADDDLSFGADCRFSHTFAAAGDYLLEVRDNKFAGGGRYRLRVGDFPLVSSPFPVGARLGSLTRLQFAGPGIEGMAAQFLRIPETVTSGRLPLSAKLPGGKSSAMAMLAVSNFPEVVETEPNADMKSATTVTLPAAVNGTLQATGDQDFYSFAGVKGQSVVFKAMSRSLGSPSYLYLRVVNADGAPVAEGSVGDADEMVIPFTFPADGMYGLMVEDLLRRGGPEYAYRVEIAPAPGFSLSLKNDPKTLTKFLTPVANGAFAVEVQVARSGYDGPIQLSIDPPQHGYRLFSAVIPEKAAAGRVIIAVPPQQRPGDLRTLQIVGTAMIGDRTERQVVTTTALLKARLPQIAYPPSWLDGMLTVATAAEMPPFFQPSAVSPVFVPQHLGKAEFAVTMERKNAEFKDPVTMQAESAPPGLAAAIKQDKDQYQVSLAGAAGLPSGQQTLKLVSYGEFQGRGQIQIQDIPVEIAPALSLQLTPAGPVIAGQKQKVKITLARKGTDKQPVTVTWKSLPPGVTGDASLTIAADQDSLEAELTAAADAAAGSFAQLTAEAKTTYGGQPLAVVSPAATIETKKP